MNIILNGESHQTTAQNLHMLLKELAIDDKRIIVLIDDEPIKKECFETTALVEAMRLELLEFVGGG
ncbi:sulfur carrier protein ThiS [Macrococcus brunensis]|uniref:Sulfur carrier protein ThiS n=1 Tax=Macrococcus brunensis TaxID=198483 RepID=A0A4R6BEZ7_9STAP|nr:sulfur carrier protein ThiS [Macrococcus brunensis]TDL98375.1 sulfur carrier protein ThiS [Macrococcus brunensis]ULG72037.1 sulfur carrier protein ThiS [Macrococcus brunensis]ULG74290.1 sulfur carrier protein ThiS [Macrococcus brunensis]